MEFTTLRAFPFERTTTVLAHELRALPRQWGRFANLERVRSQAQNERWAKMSFFRKVFEIINEPRWKFYVKEGRSYTVKSGVPGVWEEIASVIQRRTEADKRIGNKQSGKKTGMLSGDESTIKATVVPDRKPKVLRRQTSRTRV